METRPEGVRLVPSPRWSSEAVLPFAALASGVALLTPLLRKRSALTWIAAATGGVLAYQGVEMLRTGRRSGSTTQFLRQSIEVNADPTELTRLWHNSGVLNAVMQPWGSVAADGPDRLRWSVDVPVHGALSGDAYQVELRPGELVHWRTGADSPLQIDEWFRVDAGGGNGGSRVTLEYRIDYSRMPGGALLEGMAELFRRAPELLILNVLEKLKGMAETGTAQGSAIRTRAL